jgi:hypothetical protein
MGADLYIWPLHQRQRQQWEPPFEEAVRQRDSLAVGTDEHRKAQERVKKCFDRMFERGFYRDPYNDWDLLWKFDLSWWSDVIPMLDDQGQLPVEQARRLLGLLSEREDVFALKLAEMPANDQQYFRRRYTDLQKFLHEAIELNTPIDASL